MIPPTLLKEVEAAAKHILFKAQILKNGDDMMTHLYKQGWFDCFARLLEMSEGEFDVETADIDSEGYEHNVYTADPDGVASHPAKHWVDGRRYQHALSQAALLKDEDCMEMFKAYDQLKGLLRDHQDDWKRIQDAERALEGGNIANYVERNIKLTEELAAYKKAKAENDERFQLELGEAKAEIERLKTEEANRCEEFAEALGEIGIDVSCCYDFSDLVGRISSLVHETEIEKANARIKELETEVEQCHKDIVKVGENRLNETAAGQHILKVEEREQNLVAVLEEIIASSLYICTHWPNELAQSAGARLFSQALHEGDEALKANKGGA